MSGLLKVLLVSACLMAGLSVAPSLARAGEWIKTRNLVPGQGALAFDEVDIKLAAMKLLTAKQLSRQFEKEPPLGIRLSDERVVIIDGNHDCMAAYELGVKKVYVDIIDDYSELTEAQAWNRLVERNLYWPFDGDDRRLRISDYPQSYDEVTNDPYRFLAWSVRKLGGFNKTSTPFAEFAWSRYFRSQIPATYLRSNPDAALAWALRIAQIPNAQKLPGYIGPKIKCHQLLSPPFDPSDLD